MFLALAAYENKIASLFESSNNFVIIPAPSYNIQNSRRVRIENNSTNILLQLLKENQVGILICGAINKCIRRLLEAQGIQVIPWITGDITNVVEAFRSGNLNSSTFIMPGCRQKRYGHHRFRRGVSYY